MSWTCRTSMIVHFIVWSQGYYPRRFLISEKMSRPPNNQGSWEALCCPHCPSTASVNLTGHVTQMRWRWGKKVSFNKKEGTLFIFFLNGRKNCVESKKAKALYIVKFTDYHSKQAPVQLREQRRAGRKGRRMGDMTTAARWIFLKLLETQFQLKENVRLPLIRCLSSSSHSHTNRRLLFSSRYHGLTRMVVTM